MNPIVIERPCPSCKQEGQVVLHKNRFHCLNDACSFETDYLCPICNASVSEETFAEDAHGAYFKCVSCSNVVHLQRIVHLITNSLVIDHDHRCQFCNGPMVHRADVNIGHRCFFFPKCSGQADLFDSKKESLVFLDFETTGLEAGKDAIIEIGAIKIDEEGFERTFQTFVAPNFDLDPKITQITGITNEMLTNAPSLKSSMEKLAEFIGNSTIVAHNADFDLLWLGTSYLRLEIPNQNNQVICTLKWAKSNNESHCSLGALTKKYAIRHRNAHRALADAVATKELFFIFEDMKKAKRPVFFFNDFIEISKRIVRRYQAFVQA